MELLSDDVDYDIDFLKSKMPSHDQVYNQRIMVIDILYPFFEMLQRRQRLKVLSSFGAKIDLARFGLYSSRAFVKGP